MRHNHSGFSLNTSSPSHPPPTSKHSFLPSSALNWLDIHDNVDRLYRVCNIEAIMKSLRYIFAGQPQTLGDCLDLARTQSLNAVTLDLVVDKFVGELWILHELIGIYHWNFANRSVCCKELYGCVSPSATKQQCRAALANANARLQRRIEEIHSRGIRTVGSDQRFEEWECARCFSGGR